jgi:luciferase family oxidoreductase group 1
MTKRIPFSVLDLCPVTEGATARDSFDNARDLAQLAERLGYTRYWLAEHHNMPGIASAATSLVIGHVAAGTSTIRIGAGGIMLPNHAPLIIAEQFGTLAELYPGRIDLGLGRAPGTDQGTAQALRRTLQGNVDRFPQDVVELMYYLRPAQDNQPVRAVPGEGTEVPLWILGSSLYGAHLAAALGLPYAFASHFAPQALHEAIALYRERFEPSPQLSEPYVMLSFNVFAADTDGEARTAFTSLQQAFLNLRRGQPRRLPPPVESLPVSPGEEAMLAESLSRSAVGSEATVREKIAAFLDETDADELIVTTMMYDHEARRRSFEITARVRDALFADTAPLETAV